MENAQTPAVHHLIAGRGKAFGGLTGLVLYTISWGLWFYFWAVFAASGISFVRSGYDILETLELTGRSVLYPFIALPMQLIVIPYEWLYCPLHYWWRTMSLPFGFKKGAHTLDQVSLADQKKMYLNWAEDHATQNQKYINELEALWKKETGSTWYQLFGGIWPANDPVHQQEINMAYQFGYDIAAPIYDAKHGYVSPKYCPIRDKQGKTDPYRTGCKIPTTIFSWDWWFCRNPKVTNCTVPCSIPTSDQF